MLFDTYLIFVSKLLYFFDGLLKKLSFLLV